MVIEKKLIKHCKMGDIEFDLGINRSMSIEAFKKFPSYWETINKSNQVKKAVKNKGNFEIDSSNIVEITELEDALMHISIEIVEYLLPKMLEYSGRNTVPSNFSGYEEWADYILHFCYDNGILLDFINDNNEGTVGFINIVMEFVQLAFMGGGEKKKSNLTITLE